MNRDVGARQPPKWTDRMRHARHYLLIVRFPTGGIRTHLAYASRLAENADTFLPVLVCPDGEEGRALAKQLQIPAERCFLTENESVRSLAIGIWRAARRYRVRVAHSHGFSSAVAAFSSVVFFGLRHVVTVHDQVTQGLLEHIGHAKAVILGFVLRVAYVVHAVGEDCAESVRNLPFMRHATNVRIIPNGIERGRFANVIAVDVRRECRIPDRTFLIGFFGRFMSPKGFRVLVDAIRVLDGCAQAAEFHVIAVGGGGFVREDKAYIARLNLTHRFSFFDFVENPAALMAAMDVVTMPSRWEAYGLVAAEALALGIPLIASDCIGLREVTRGTPARVFPSGDATALAEQLVAEMTDPTKSMTEAYRPEALRRFDFSQSARDIQSMLLDANG